MRRVVATLAETFGIKESNLRQRLREWYWDKQNKKGRQRSDWQVDQSFAALLKWIVGLWSPEAHQLALAMDATTLKDRFVVLSISVVFRGCAIPVAWAVLQAEQKGTWKEHWLRLLAHLEGVIPADWLVIVLADRGLYARWLFEAIRACGWHPFLRINTGSLYRPKGTAAFVHMRHLLPQPGKTWAGQVTCFANNPVEATLLACWGARHKQPWFILTDLLPESTSAAWYGLRSWIEHGFQDLKRGGWQWHNTRMTDPDRAARLWLALAVATLWVVNVGGDADANLPAADLELLPPTHIARRTRSRTPRSRCLSCFTRGLIGVLAALLYKLPISLYVFLPEPWPLNTYP